MPEEHTELELVDGALKRAADPAASAGRASETEGYCTTGGHKHTSRVSKSK